MILSEHLGKWLLEEREQQALKFSHESQVVALRAGRITANECFGGQAGSYWGRLQNIRSKDEFQADKTRRDLLPFTAQYAGKTLNSVTALWTTLKTVNQDEYGGTREMVIRDVVDSTAALDAKVAYHWLEQRDFGRTHTGLGIGTYSDEIHRRGIPETNLGIALDLIRIRGIYLDAAAVALAQFNECFEETGVLPVGGTSSGNIELYSPQV